MLRTPKCHFAQSRKAVKKKLPLSAGLGAFASWRATMNGVRSMLNDRALSVEHFYADVAKLEQSILPLDADMARPVLNIGCRGNQHPV